MSPHPPPGTGTPAQPGTGTSAPPARLMLLDSASLYFRAFHGVPSSITAPDGSPVNAVRGFLDSIAFLVTTWSPTRLVACWDDDWRPAFRVRALASYKAHRVAPAGGEDAPDALLPQVDVIVAVLAALGVARVGAPGFEADDVMATLAAREAAARGGAGVDVVTGDRDLFQVVDDAADVRVLYCGKGVRKADVVTQSWLSQRYGVGTGQAYADMSVLRGDPSDGLPGVAGVGEKTAAALIARYGDLAGLRAAADDPESGLSPGQRRKLLEGADYLDAAPVVVGTVRDVPVGPVADAVPHRPADMDALGELTHRWGLQSSVERVLTAFAAAPR